MPQIPHTYCASYLFLIQDGKVLLSRRFNTGFEDGKYSVPAGHVESGESFVQTLIREVKEEIDITISSTDIQSYHTLHRRSSDRECIGIFFIVEKWIGEPKNMEPGKCDDLAWFPLDNLPSNIIPYVRLALENSLKHIPYAEVGWK